MSMRTRHRYRHVAVAEEVYASIWISVFEAVNDKSGRIIFPDIFEIAVGSRLGFELGKDHARHAAY